MVKMKTQGTRGSAFDGFIRATEQDDFLLYVTAAVGVLMPGCVYLFYRYAHKLYCQYAQVSPFSSLSGLCSS